MEVLEAKKKAVAKEVQELASKVHQAKSEIIEFKNKIKMLDMEIKAKQSHINSFKAQVF